MKLNCPKPVELMILDGFDDSEIKSNDAITPAEPPTRTLSWNIPADMAVNPADDSRY